MLALSNDHHQPAGAPGGIGGQFAPGVNALLEEVRANPRGVGVRAITIGRVGERLAGEIEAALGIDVAGRPITLTEDLIRKNDKAVRNPKIARDHGHLPTQDVDYHRLGDVMAEPDAVERGEPRPDGPQTVNVFKRFNGFFYAAAAVRNGKGDLLVVRFVRLEKGSAQLPRLLRATPEGGVARTSETTSEIVGPTMKSTALNREPSMQVSRWATFSNDGDASDHLLLDRGSRGDEGHFVTIDHRAVFIPDDHGVGANGRGGSFTRHGLEKKLVAHHESRGGNWMEEHRDVLAEGSGGDLQGASRFTFHRELPGEVKRHIENNPAARRLFRTTHVAAEAKGSDALASMGDRYFDMVDDAAGGHLRKALETAEESDDPEARFHAALYRELPDGRQKAKQGIVSADKLREGQRFTINGREFAVRADAENGLTLDGGRGFPETPVGALSEIPIDKYSLKASPTRRATPAFDESEIDDYAMDAAGERDLRAARRGRSRRASRRPADDIPFSREDDAMKHTLYLSSTSTLAPAVTLGMNLPTTHNGLPIHYQWVDSAVCGDWRHPRTGQAVPIDAVRVDAWVKNAKLALSRKVDLPAVKDHSELADASMGAIFDARAKDGRLQLLTGFYGDDSLLVAQKNKVSVGIDPNFKDSYGNKYGESIRHLAFTPVPVIHGQQGFVGLHRGEQAEVIYLSLAPKKGVDMPLDPALKTRVVTFLGTAAEVGDDAAAALAQVLGKAEAAPGQIAQLSAAVTERDTRIATLSANAVDPETLRDRADLYEERVETLLSRGDVTKAMATKLKAYVKQDGKPNVLMLSAAAGSAKRPIDGLLELFSGEKLGLRGEERTNMQSLMFSRQDPDDGPAAAQAGLDANPLIQEARRMSGQPVVPAST